jgi:hypothetical protein
MTDTPLLTKEQWFAQRAAREERIAGLYQRRQRLLLGSVLFVCVAASIVALLWIAPGKGPVQVAEHKIVSSELTSVLEQLRSGVAQRTIDRVVPRSLKAERCERELPVVLADRANPLFLPAVLLAGHFGITSLAPQLRAALPTPDAETNRQLVLTVQALQPWSDDDLSNLLGSEAPGVVAAAASVCAKRQGQPPEKILSALCGNAPEARQAALEAVPSMPSDDFAAALASQMQFMQTNEIGEALEAILRCQHNKVVEKILYERLSEVGEGCDKALSALAKNGEALAFPATVLAIAKDPSRKVTTRSRALYCLERTGAAVPPEVLTSLYPEHPALDYFAARMLLRAGYAEGVQLLLRIVDSTAEDEPPQRIVAQAKVGARQLLAHLADTSPYDEPHIWKEWASSNPIIKIDSLPEPRIDLEAEFAPQ